MNKQQPLYDVYVSYPPGVDHGRVDACIRDNLPDTEAEGLIGKLLSADETGIQLEKVTKLRRVKKVIPEPEILTILYTDIKTAVTQIEF